MQTSDGGYVVVGGTGAVRGPGDGYVVRTTPTGTILWQRRYGRADADEVFNDVCAASLGGFVLVGRANRGANSVYVVRIDSLGSVVWESTLPEDTMQGVIRVRAARDGEFLIAGAMCGVRRRAGVHVCALSDGGSCLWTRTIRDTYIDLPENIGLDMTRTGGVVVAAKRGWAGLRLLEFDSTGATVWERTYPGLGLGEGQDVATTRDGGFVVTGLAKSDADPDDPGQLYIARMDSLGNSLWVRTFGDSSEDFGMRVRQVGDDGFIAVGRRGVGSPQTDIDAFVVCTTSDGSLMWRLTFGNDGWADDARDVRQTSDGGFVITGMRAGWGGTSTVMYLRKLKP
jgi:hypothetical protein